MEFLEVEYRCVCVKNKNSVLVILLGDSYVIQVDMLKLEIKDESEI